MSAVFEYEQQARRPLTYAGLAVAAGLLAIAWLYAAPWYVTGIWGTTFVLLMRHAMINGSGGSRIDHVIFDAWCADQHWSWRLEEIDRAQLVTGSDGQHRWQVHLTNGQSQTLPTLATSQTDFYAQELERHGIRVGD